MAKTKSYTFTANEARVLQILREHYAKTEDVEPQNISIEALIENEVLPAGKQQTVFNGISGS